jgi:hypothetical protein
VYNDFILLSIPLTLSGDTRKLREFLTPDQEAGGCQLYYKDGGGSDPAGKNSIEAEFKQ